MSAVNLFVIGNFNSHAHVERDSCITIDFLHKHDFNSHAHVERDFLAKRHINHSFISTHTLTWSVTNNKKTKHKNKNISTHTLTWSVTSKYKHTIYCVLHFNSHAHVERDT